MHALTIGAATVTRIEETYEPNFAAATFFPAWQPEALERDRDWLVPDHYDAASGFLKLSIHSWLIRLDGRNILIDTCVGNHKERPARPKWHRMETHYLQRLSDAGVRPDEIDLVMCTHLHVDHVGWNTRLDNGRWVPTFPKARYVFSKADFDYYANLDRDPEKGPANLGSFRDSVMPVMDAGLGEVVSGAHILDEHLSIDPAPGHTPGSVAVKLASKGRRCVFSGDILHHAIQLAHPEWNSFVCYDGASARRSRRSLLEQCVGGGDLLMPAHFGAPFACHVEAKGEAFAPRFV